MEAQKSIDPSINSTLDASIIRALSYAHVFKYPLKKDEIVSSMDMPVTDLTSIDVTLEKMEKDGFIHSFDECYSLVPDKALFDKRKDLNKQAQKSLKVAYKISRFIGNFPFVRAVFLSGSITKNSMDKDSDIDYFVITEPGRLWFTRTVLIGFKKVFLLNSYKLFCLNYFVDKNNLEIHDRNLYVALEISTLIPTYGRANCEAFEKSNKWVNEFVPNSKEKDFSGVRENSVRGIKWLSEKVFNGKLGDYFNQKFKRISENYWSKKFKNVNVQSDYFVSKANISALHPDNFKLSILKRYDEILKEQEERMNYQLD